MAANPALTDLVALVADIDQEAVIKVLLEERCAALQIRPVCYELRRHPNRDPGVLKQAADFLRPYNRTHSRAIVLLDCEGAGAPGPADQIEETIATNLQRNGWSGDRSCVVAVSPEIEAWAWRSMNALCGLLGTDEAALRKLGREGGWWNPKAPKPARPKELLESALRLVGKPRSSSLYAQLAREVPLGDCQDTSFQRLVEALQRWFPAA